MSEPQREFAVDVVRRLRAAGYDALFAGGAVRDLVRGEPATDYDVATSARPEDVQRVFGRSRTLAVGVSFGVILVLAPRGCSPVEVATFRREGEYVDGRRPTGVEFCSAEEDACRRDFTINGMFFDPLTEQVFDYVGGRADLDAKQVRAIGTPRDRMQEDKLRLLRAVRFAAKLNYEIEAATRAAIVELADQVQVVSAERIGQEFRKILVDESRVRGVDLMFDLGLMPFVLPELVAIWNAPRLRDLARQAIGDLRAPAFSTAAATVLHPLISDAGNPDDVVSAVVPRLKLSNAERDDISWIFRHRAMLNRAADLSLAELKPLVAHPLFPNLAGVVGAWRRADGLDGTPIEFCEQYRRRTPAEQLNPPPLVTGADLIERGHVPGPQFKAILQDFRDRQLNEELVSREAALAELHQ